MRQNGEGISVYLIDDEAIVRAGLRALLRQNDGFAVVGDSGDPHEAIWQVGELRPDVVMLDIRMPGLSGVDLVGPIRKASPATKILICSQHESQTLVHQAISAGVDGYLSKSSDPDELRLAIESICRGESFVSARIVPTLVGWLRDGVGDAGRGTRLDQLSAREREVFQLIAIGKTNKEIASKLDVSLATVKKHRENLHKKLECKSAVEIARLAIREGLVGP